MSEKNISTLALILRGYLWVNIPVIIVIIGSWIGLLAFTDIRHTVSIIIAVIIGWIYWEFTIPIWIKWALQNEVDEKRLLKIGQQSLLLWNDMQIQKVKKKMNE